jgi:hypothetical protein
MGFGGTNWSQSFCSRQFCNPPGVPSISHKSWKGPKDPKASAEKSTLSLNFIDELGKKYPDSAKHQRRRTRDLCHI